MDPRIRADHAPENTRNSGRRGVAAPARSSRSILTNGSLGRLARAGGALGPATALGAGLFAAPAQAQDVSPVQTWTGATGAAAGSSISQQSCDFTGDDRQDIVTSAWMWDRAPYGSIGATYVIPDGATPGELDDPSTGAIRIEGPQTDSPLTGFSVSCAGDVNGDGYSEVIIGDYMESRAWVVFGSRDRSDISLSNLGDRGFIIQGDDDSSGYQVTGLGDLDGDGKAEVGVTSLKANDRQGSVAVVRGRTSISTVDLTKSRDVMARIKGAPKQGISTVAPAGDDNGDGRPDLVLGGYVAVPSGATTTANGMAWVLFGGTRGTVDLGQSFRGFTVNGPARGRDRLGMSVAAAGDVDVDGLGDLLIGTDGVSQRSADGTLDSRPGGAVVVRGSRTRDTVQTDPQAASGKSVWSGSTNRGWWIQAPEDGSHAGYSVAAVKPANPRVSGTLLLGAWGSSTAWGIDTRALDAPVVKIADIASDRITTLSDTDQNARLGRAVGVVRGFNGHEGPQMVAGGDYIGGEGRIEVADLPATGPVHRTPTTGGGSVGSPSLPGQGSTSTHQSTQHRSERTH